MGRFRKQKKKVAPPPNIVLLKIAIGQEWNKMSEELILKAYKSFRRCVDAIILKNGGNIE